MSEEKIDQKVILSDQAQVHGDITLIGKVVNIITHPAKWQDAIFDFVSAHRVVVAAIVVVELALLALYGSFQALHRIPWWVWAITAVLLVVAIWTFYSIRREGRSSGRLLFAVGSTIAVANLIGWQGWQVANPPVFDSLAFGIAVADLRPPGPVSLSSHARLLSDQIYERLCRDIGSEFTAGTEEDRCTSAATDQTRPIVVRRIGVVANSQVAHSYGAEIGAEIVVWGQLLGPESGGATIRFEILETLDQAVNPDYPVVMPVTAANADIFASISERDLNNDPVEVKRIVSQQSIVISSFTLGLAAYLDQNFPQAIRQLHKAAGTIDQNPELEMAREGTSLLYAYLGKAYHALGRVAEGQNWLLQAQELNPEEPSSYINLALGYGSLAQPETRDEQLRSALSVLNQWLSTHPDDTNARYDRGLVHQIRKQPANAVIDYEAVLEKDPSFYIVYLQLSNSLYELGRTAEAISRLEQALDLAGEVGTNASWAHLQLGAIYQRENQPAAAKEAYQRAIALDPNVDRMHYFYARFLESQGETDAALFAYQNMVEVSFNEGWAYGELGHFYRRRNLLEPALSSFQRATNAEATDPLLYTYLGETYFLLGREAEALEAFNEAVALNEDRGVYFVHATYAGVLLSLGQADQAIAQYERSLTLRPVDYPVLMNLGQTYMIAGDPQRAAGIYERVIALEAHFTEAQVQAARDHLAAIREVAP